MLLSNALCAFPEERRALASGRRGTESLVGLGRRRPAKLWSPCSHTQEPGRPPRDLGKPGMRAGGWQDPPRPPCSPSPHALAAGGPAPAVPVPSRLALPPLSLHVLRVVTGWGSPAESAPTGSIVSRDSPCTLEDSSGPCLLPTPEDRPELCVSAASSGGHLMFVALRGGLLNNSIS